MSDLFKDILPSSFFPPQISELEPLHTIGNILNGLELLGLTDDSVENFTDGAKIAYIKSKLSPKDDKEKAHLESRLAITYTEKQTNQLQLDALSKTAQDFSKAMIDKSKLISRKSKLESYVKELSTEYDELEHLKQEEKEILDRFVYHNFQTERLNRGFFESDQAYANRVISYEAQLRKEFVQKNREKVLLEALKSTIIKEMPNFLGEATLLEREDNAQTLLTPLYKQRIAERYEEIEKLKKDREYNRYYSYPLQPKKHITNDAPELNLSVGMHYRHALLQKELLKEREPVVMDPQEKQKRLALIEKNQKLSNAASYWNKNTTENNVWQGKAQAFKKLV